MGFYIYVWEGKEKEWNKDLSISSTEECGKSWCSWICKELGCEVLRFEGRKGQEVANWHNLYGDWEWIQKKVSRLSKTEGFSEKKRIFRKVNIDIKVWRFQSWKIAVSVKKKDRGSSQDVEKSWSIMKQK